MRKLSNLTCLILLTQAGSAAAEDIKQTEVYRRIKASIDAVPAIDTHDHLRPFQRLPKSGRNAPRSRDDAV